MKKIISLVAVAIIATYGCSKSNPNLSGTASFTTNSTNYYLTQSIAFNNTSTNARSNSWNFDDGNISTTKSPSHSFSTGATYIVKLTVNGVSTATKSLVIDTGSASYQVRNQTDVALPLVSFATDANGNILDFVEDGAITSGGLGPVIYTSAAQIYIGGTLSDGSLFIAIYPHTLTKFYDNVIALADTSQVYIGANNIGMNKKQIFDMLLHPKMFAIKKRTLQQLQRTKQIVQ